MTSEKKKWNWGRPSSSQGFPSSSSSSQSASLSRPSTADTLTRRPLLTHQNSNDDRSAFGKSLSSMMNSLSLSRTSTRDSTNPGSSSPVPIFSQLSNDDSNNGARGRSLAKAIKHSKSASQAPPDQAPSDRSRSRARSSSPFSFRKFRRSTNYSKKTSDDGPAARSRDQSPAPSTHSVAALAQSDAEVSDGESIRPRYSSYSYDSDTDLPLSRTSSRGEDAEEDHDVDDWSDDDLMFDPATQMNTQHNSVTAPCPVVEEANLADVDIDPDPLGEGQNVVVPPEPYFPTTLNSTSPRKRGGPGSTKRKKSLKHHEPLELQTSRPSFQRDRCTITITQGDPQAKLRPEANEGKERRKRRYIVASDMSEESRYALEWAIGTVLRDGDELLVVTVNENETKVDPASGQQADRTTKLRAQQERQALAYILLRQTTSLLQRTRLHVIVQCQGWHAKNARHMLLDIADHYEPQMLIVGSRGLGKLKGILLGSTSHYLIQKCSVPVMVARRRLKRPPRRSAHLSTSRKQHVSLAQAAAIDRVVHRVDEDVKSMRDEIKREDDKRAKEKDMGLHGGGGGAMNMVGGGKNLGLGSSGGMTPAGGMGAGAGVGRSGGIGGEGAIEEEDEKSDDDEDGDDADGETETEEESGTLGKKVAGDH